MFGTNKENYHTCSAGTTISSTCVWSFPPIATRIEESHTQPMNTWQRNGPHRMYNSLRSISKPDGCAIPLHACVCFIHEVYPNEGNLAHYPHRILGNRSMGQGTFNRCNYFTVIQHHCLSFSAVSRPRSLPIVCYICITKVRASECDDHVDIYCVRRHLA